MSGVRPAAGICLSLAIGLATGCTQREPSKAPDKAAIAPVKPPPARDIAGIKIGQPADLPECEKEKTANLVHYSAFPNRVPCWGYAIGDKDSKSLTPEKHMPSKGDFDIEFGQANVPTGVYTAGRGSVIDGKIERIELKTFGSSNQGEILGLLAKKWGEPSASSVQNYQNGFGAQFSGTTAQWNFDDFTIIYMSFAGTPDEGVIIVNSAVYMATVKAQEPQSAKSF